MVSQQPAYVVGANAVAPLSHWYLIFEAEHPLRRAEAGEGEFPESSEVARAAAREFIGGEDPASQLTRQLFNARGEIDGRTNAGEIEPIGAADIAVEDI